MASLALPVIASGSGLERYIRDVQKFPMLEAQEEYMLARRYLDHGDMEAAHRMVTSHLRLVVKIASGFRGYGLPFAEMVSEGNIGLMHAVKRFDPEKGFRLSTYAMWWIKAAIQEYILRSWSLVKVGASQAHKKLFFNLNRIKHRIRAADDGNLTHEQVSQIANELGVDEEDVVAMNHRMIASDRPLNATMGGDSDTQWMDVLPDERDNQEVMLGEYQEATQRQNKLRDALGQLNERERDILSGRRLTDPAVTLEELSQKYGISRERVRQIENRAFEKLQALVAPQVKALPAPKA
ncbi:RNA polymerase sigma factor RpoH [bacterium]|nr:RNA polymerase sigma factor RpoH [bacterium]